MRCKVTVSISIWQFDPVYEAVKRGLDIFLLILTCLQRMSGWCVTMLQCHCSGHPRQVTPLAVKTLLAGHQDFIATNVFKLQNGNVYFVFTIRGESSDAV